MVVPRVYRTAGENIISVGYTDVATGKSRTNIYAGIVKQGYASGAVVVAGTVASGAGVLSNVAFYSDAISTFSQGAADPHDYEHYGKVFDLDFDIPQTIEGQTIIQIPIAVTTVSASNNWVNIELHKVNSSNAETIITSGATRAIYVTGTLTSGAMLSWFYDFPRTGFKSGEKLRLKVIGLNSTSDGSIWIGCDPKGRSWLGDISSVTSTLVMQIPFRIDL